MKPIHYSIQVRGTLVDLSTPQVMGILNCTPDSFYAGSRKQTEEEIAQWIPTDRLWLVAALRSGKLILLTM